MRAVIFEGEGKFRIADVPQPTLRDVQFPKKYLTPRGEREFVRFKKEAMVLLKVLMAGICGTDLHILRVPPGHDAIPGVILGHEYVGEVVKVGGHVKSVKVGDLVAVDPNIKCGLCWFCRNDMASLCPNLTTLGIFCDGGFAEYNLAPARQLFVLPEGMKLETAALFEPLSCVMHGWQKLNFKVGDSVLIYGAGPIGCLFVKVAKASGASLVIVSEPDDFRREQVRMAGADVVIDPKRENLSEVVKSVTSRGETFGVDITIDACGVPQTIVEGLELTRPGGVISTFGEQDVTRLAHQVSFTKVTQKELRIVGSYVTTRSFDQTIALLKRRELKFDQLITHKFVLSEFDRGLEVMRGGKAIKVLIHP
jgi:2-desacetyl-2-hydroxyethyl bacteriochlorophyllide A dehydrogenase